MQHLACICTTCHVLHSRLDGGCCSTMVAACRRHKQRLHLLTRTVIPALAHTLAQQAMHQLHAYALHCAAARGARPQHALHTKNLRKLHVNNNYNCHSTVNNTNAVQWPPLKATYTHSVVTVLAGLKVSMRMPCSLLEPLERCGRQIQHPP